MIMLVIVMIFISKLPASMVWASEDGTPGNPYKILVAADFDLMRNNLSASFILENNIDLTGVSWTTIGQDDLSPFVGNFDGQGHSINDLSINSVVGFSGLFGAVGTNGMIKNLEIMNATVVGDHKVGVLAGYNQGNIENVTITNANVTITNANVTDDGDFVGGLVGVNNQGSIRNSHVSGVVSGDHFVGGLVGNNESSLIEDSSAAVIVNGMFYYVGGLVGYNSSSSINNSYTSGDVSSDAHAGGLVGFNTNHSFINNSYALGNVSSISYTGSLVGYNYDYSSINDSYASGLSNDNQNILLGGDGGSATTINSYWRSYIISFNSNGGSAVSIQGVNNGTASAPTAPTRTGYIFVDWYSDSGLTTTYDFSSVITANKMLYAKWDAVAEATLAVTIAEMYQTQISVDAASLLVINLSSDLEKNALLVRLAVVQSIINNTMIHIDNIVKLINEGTLQQKDINQDNIFDYKDIEIMLQRISPLK